MDEKEQRDAELDTEKGLDSQSLKIKQEAGLELEAETESLFSDSAILSPFACPVDLIDPGLLTSSEASSPSPCGFQSFPSYTPPDSQSTSSTPLFETFGDVTLHETIPTICKEMYGDQQPPLYPRMYPCMTELEETLMLCPTYSGPSTPASTSSWPDEGVSVANMPLPLPLPQPPLEDGGNDKAGYFTECGGNGTINDEYMALQSAQAALSEPFLQPYGSYMSLCRSHQAAAAMPMFVSPKSNNLYAEENTQEDNRVFANPHLATSIGKRPPSIRPSRHPQHANSSSNIVETLSPHGIHPYMEESRRELGVWRSQPYPPLESRPGSRTGARSRQQRRQMRAPTSVPDFGIKPLVMLPTGNGNAGTSVGEYASRRDGYVAPIDNPFILFISSCFMRNMNKRRKLLADKHDSRVSNRRSAELSTDALKDSPVEI